MRATFALKIGFATTLLWSLTGCETMNSAGWSDLNSQLNYMNADLAAQQGNQGAAALYKLSGDMYRIDAQQKNRAEEQRADYIRAMINNGYLQYAGEGMVAPGPGYEWANPGKQPADLSVKKKE